MSAIIVGFSIIFGILFAGAFLIRQVGNASVAWQDNETGFHLGETPPDHLHKHVGTPEGGQGGLTLIGTERETTAQGEPGRGY